MTNRCISEFDIPQREEVSIRLEPISIDENKYWLYFKKNNDFPMYLHLYKVEPSLINPKDHEVILIDSVYQEFPISAQSANIEYSTSFSYFENKKSLHSLGQYPVLKRSEIVQTSSALSFWSSLFYEKTHLTEYGQKEAVDIKADQGSTIIAFQGGTVVQVEKSYHDLGCKIENMQSRGNKLIILQDDGLQALYGHVMRGSILVSEGDRVEIGQELAKVGNSGYSKVSHLHFEIGGHTLEGYTSVPIRFYTDNSKEYWIPKLGLKISN